MCELLRRHDNLVFDQPISHSSLINDGRYAEIMEQILRAYLDVGSEQNLPQVIPANMHAGILY
jgi:hypothetical protein